MKLEKSMQLGELYRELRIARGLKLKDVARENLSVSQLSRFENGQSMLAMTYLNFLKKLIANLEDGTDDLSDLEHFIVCVEEIGNPLVASYLKMNLLRITNNSEK